MHITLMLKQVVYHSALN